MSSDTYSVFCYHRSPLPKLFACSTALLFAAFEARATLMVIRSMLTCDVGCPFKGDGTPVLPYAEFFKRSVDTGLPWTVQVALFSGTVVTLCLLSLLFRDIIVCLKITAGIVASIIFVMLSGAFETFILSGMSAWGQNEFGSEIAVLIAAVSYPRAT